MTRFQKIIISVVVLLFTTIFYFSYGNVNPHGPFLYRSLIPASQVDPRFDSIRQVILSASDTKPLINSFIRIVQELLDRRLVWKSIPSAVFFIPAVFVLLRRARSEIRIVGVFASIAGPLLAISYTFVFQRYLINILATYTFLILIITYNDSNRSLPIISISTLLSVVIWLNHYSYWIFFAMIVFFLISVRSINEKRLKLPFIIPIFAPIIIYPSPVGAYLSVLPTLGFVVSELLSGDLTSILDISKGTTISNPAMTIESAQSEPSWYSPVLHLLYIFPLSLLILCWIYINKKKINSENGGFTEFLGFYDSERQIFWAVSASFLCTSVLYIIIGYSFRILTLWPIVFPIFLNDLWRGFQISPLPKGSLYSQSQKTVAVIIIAVVIISTLHIGVIFPVQYVNDDRASKASEEQIAGSQFAEYISMNDKIYTDLLHKSVILIEVNNRMAITGRGASVDDGFAQVDQNIAVLYDSYFYQEGYVLTTINNSQGALFRGVTTERSTGTSHDRNCNRIYHNGEDVWYTSC
ncbi:hypothetical protein GOC74_16795 [Halomicrobium mukohataei]|uniref:Uncharacterized protein n=1 Tax=Halomicrobium mukohataei TaxID=57705 RepID=A0A847UGH7_9EURY|nr:hypothetical protein [Halomicrobium mukohataei]NLV11586.1 hypothetical protein [Halomicrobium mukohataei]